MKVTVIGKSPAWQDADGACSCYLVQHGDHSLVVDMGNGAFGKLRRHIDYTAVDAVAITHMHADHFIDLIPYAYALLLTPRQQPVPVAGWPGVEHPARPRLIAPAGAAGTVGTVASAWGSDNIVQNAFEMEEYQEDSVVETGPFRLSFREVPHYVPTFAIEVAVRGKRVTFGADCRPCDELVEFATDTDLLVVEATLPRPERTGIRGHLTPSEAGEHARRAGARRALLTHFSDELDPAWVRSEGQRGFGGPVGIAAEGLSIEV